MSPQLGPEPPPSNWQPEIHKVAQRAKEGDKDVLDILTDVGAWLGRGTAILANIANPEVIILGGYFAPLSTWLLPPAQVVLLDQTLAADAGGALFVASALDHRATPIGGAARILETVDAGNLPTPDMAR